MGLLDGLVTLPLAPLRGVVWVGRQVADAAERAYYDPEAIRSELAQLERDLLEGRLDEEQFDRAEDELLDRLEEAYRRTGTTIVRSPGGST
jgi:hypothetical protein